MSDRSLRERERRWRERGDLSSELAYREAAGRVHGDDPLWLDDQATCEQLVRGPRVSEQCAALASDPWIRARRSPLPGVWVLAGPSEPYLAASAERLGLEPVACWPRLRLRATPGEAELVTQVSLQSCGPGIFARIRLRLEAHAGLGVELADDSELPVEFKHVVAEALLAGSGGWLLRPEGLAARKRGGEPELSPEQLLAWIGAGVAWEGLRLRVVSGRDHAVDSNARSFRAVAQRALALCLNQLGAHLQGPTPSGDWRALEPTPTLEARRDAYLELEGAA